MAKSEIKTQEEKYASYVKEVTPTHNVFLNMLKAFIVGGIICLLAQIVLNFLMGPGIEVIRCYINRFKYLPQACKIWWGGNSCTYYRFCKFSCCPSYRV